ncbi:hypothetical protein GCM10017567_75860 [Amycolatopsis bullii]|uniref:Preprotein translocase subunit SecA n=2 Tax=Pseudonocardiaceae TaxID=2070 RepID=A0ABQ3KRN3_9PSEU|nr:hypothetical protein GCM10017567_75860 [Amycolatopsis bullii]
MIRSVDASEDPAQAIETAFHEAVDSLSERIGAFDPIRLIEAARLRFLPWGAAGQMSYSSESIASRVELLTLIALTTTTTGEIRETPSMSEFVAEAENEFDGLLQLCQVRAMMATDRADKLAMISMLIRGSEVWLRNTSYPEQAKATVIDLFDGCPEVRQALLAELGFSAADAFAVLDSCHDRQQDKLNARMQSFVELVDTALSEQASGTFEPRADEAAAALSAVWEAEAEAVTVGIDELVDATNVPEARVRAVVGRFRLDLGATTPAQVVEDYAAGRNPLRTQPLITGPDGRVMLPHHALTAGAIKENLEQHLKASTSWEIYAGHRGKLLETRTRTALQALLPGAEYRDGFEYFVPATTSESATGDPATYTKRVEGDHLVLLDDVAVIVEDKAAALSALSRGGKVNRMRTDLTGIIKKAGEQTGRLRTAIERDGGVRIDGEGWIDLGHIREVHTIAVSLDDLTSVATATAELVRAGLLAPENICWTVSLHDLELIAELVDRPAEFLLYLRRRRNPDVTELFSAPDELDLFLYFFENGLWVEPDPDQVRTAFPFLPEPSTADRRRYRNQKRAIISTRTDPLDHWYHTPDRSQAPKPAMVPSPLMPFVDELRARGTYGWLSIGATLLAGATELQERMSRFPRQLLDAPREDGNGRTLTMPVTGTSDPAEGWLLVWMTRPAGQSPAAFEHNSQRYLRLKKHQLSLPRGVVFAYDEPTRAFLGAHYDGDTGPLTASLEADLGRLQPPEAMQRRPPPPRKAKRKPRKRK